MRDEVLVQFDAKISEKQKKHLEYAARLGGFKTLGEFMVHAAEVEAEKIVQKHNEILASEKDREVFFDSLMNPPKPGSKLRKAAASYKSSK